MRIEFDVELARGIEAYDDVLGHWWHRQSSNAAHRAAYRRIAEYVAASFQDSPGVIVDYACGAGNLLCNLATRYRHSRLIGMDGSSRLLALAERRLARAGADTGKRVTFIRTVLPNPGIRLRANLVLFTFPNMLPPNVSDQHEPGSMLSAGDLRVARAIASAEQRDSGAGACRDLLLDRSVAGNLRALLCRGGHCVRVEYSSVPRDRMTRDEHIRAAFEEGTAQSATGKPWFRIVASAYFRSRVIEDLHHQGTGTAGGRGGYQVTIFRAL